MSFGNYKRFLGVALSVHCPDMSWWAGEVKSMSLTGEYVYLLLKPLDMKFFLVHLDWGVGDKVVRRSMVALGGWEIGVGLAGW